MMIIIIIFIIVGNCCCCCWTTDEHEPFGKELLGVHSISIINALCGTFICVEKFFTCALKMDGKP